MDALRVAIDVSRGIGDSYYNQLLREGNRDANLGMNHFFSCITQYSLFENTFNKINEIFQNTQFVTRQPFIPSLLIHSISLCIPLSLTFAKKSINFTSHPNLYTIITTIDTNILPNVILVTNLVVSVACMAFSNPIYGGVNVIFLFLHLIHEQGWVNTDFIEKGIILNFTLGILNISIITKSLHSIINNHSLNPYHTWKLADKLYQVINYIRKPVAITISSITLHEYESKYSELTAIPYRLHEYHLLKDPVSNCPLDDLTHQFDDYTRVLKGYLQQDLSAYHVKFLDKFHNEEKWIQDYNNNPIDYLNHGINSFIHTIKISDNSEFKNKALSVIRYMSNLPKDEKINFLANLAITGHYCPERLYSDTRLLYDTYVDTLESRTLSTKIIDILHQERLQIVDQFLAGINQVKSLFRPMELPTDSQSILQRLSNLMIQVVSSLIPPMDDIHFANSMKHILCPYLYAHHKSIDALTHIDKKQLDWVLLTWIYKKNGAIPLIESMFLHQYNPHIVFKRISDIIEKEPIISTFEMDQWFIEQYMCDYPEATRGQAVKWVQEEVYALDDEFIPKIKPYYILFFLVNQGVLKIEDSPNFDQIPKRATEIISILRI